jgi:hypothetical protein
MSEHQDECPLWVHFAREQVELLRRCIDEHKWYLSQQAGYDVGRHVAEADFTRTHADRVAAEFRQEFCQRRCGRRDLCRRAARVGDLNRFWAGVGSKPQTTNGAWGGHRPAAQSTVVFTEATRTAPEPRSDRGQTTQQQS